MSSPTDSLQKENKRKKTGQSLHEYEVCTHPFLLPNSWALSGQEGSLIKASV